MWTLVVCIFGVDLKSNPVEHIFPECDTLICVFAPKFRHFGCFLFVFFFFRTSFVRWFGRVLCQPRHRRCRLFAWRSSFSPSSSPWSSFVVLLHFALFLLSPTSHLSILFSFTWVFKYVLVSVNYVHHKKTWCFLYQEMESYDIGWFGPWWFRWCSLDKVYRWFWSIDWLDSGWFECMSFLRMGRSNAQTSWARGFCHVPAHRCYQYEVSIWGECTMYRCLSVRCMTACCVSQIRWFTYGIGCEFHFRLFLYVVCFLFHPREQKNEWKRRERERKNEKETIRNDKKNGLFSLFQTKNNCNMWFLEIFPW